MVKKFLVSLLTTTGSVKNVIIEADDHNKAKDVASTKYPAYEIIRITSNDRDINYFSTVKKMRKEK